MPDTCQLFGSVTETYRALQEWCAPRILIDSTEAYSAVPQMSLIEANNVFLAPDFVHLLRNPRECFSDAQVPCDIVELEQQWVKFTKYMLQHEATDVLEIRYEALKSAISAISSRLSISAHELLLDYAKYEVGDIYEGPLQSDTCAIAWRLGYSLSRENMNMYRFINPKAKQGVVVWRREGDTSKAVVVFLNGISGLAGGAELQS